MMESVLTWIESSALHNLMLDTAWVFPASETVHFFGLIVLFGSVGIVDLRLLGMVRAIPLQSMLAFIPLSLIGFCLNAFTGVLFFFADPFRYYPNIAFRLKIVAIVLAGVNAIWFKYAVHRKISQSEELATDAKVIAGLSLLIWIFVIVAGRMIPYVE
jgi:hypothetical protein